MRIIPSTYHGRPGFLVYGKPQKGWQTPRVFARHGFEVLWARRYGLDGLCELWRYFA